MWKDPVRWALMGFAGALAAGFLVVDLPGGADAHDVATVPASFSISVSTAQAHHPCCCDYGDGTFDIVDHETCEEEGGSCTAMSECNDARPFEPFTPAPRGR